MVDKQQKESALLSFITWLSGILVTLVVGAGLIESNLTIPLIPIFLTQLVGWFLILAAIVSILLAIFEK